MKKTIFILSLLLFASLSSRALQSATLTNDDSASHKINSLEHPLSKQKIENALPPLQQTYQPEQTLENLTESPESQPVVIKMYNHTYRVAIDGGWGYYGGDILDVNLVSPYSYQKKLEHGYAFRISAQRFWKINIGWGVTYSLFRTSHSSNDMNTLDGLHHSVKDDISIHFGGATLNLRIPSCKNKNAFLAEIGLGYLGYFNNGFLTDRDVKIRANTLGTIFAIGYDVGLSEHMACGIQASLVAGSTGKIKYISDEARETKEFDDEDKPLIAHLNITVGLRFQMKK